MNKRRIINISNFREETGKKRKKFAVIITDGPFKLYLQALLAITKQLGLKEKKKTVYIQRSAKNAKKVEAIIFGDAKGSQRYDFRLEEDVETLVPWTKNIFDLVEDFEQIVKFLEKNYSRRKFYSKFTDNLFNVLHGVSTKTPGYNFYPAFEENLVLFEDEDEDEDDDYYYDDIYVQQPKKRYYKKSRNIVDNSFYTKKDRETVNIRVDGKKVAEVNVPRRDRDFIQRIPGLEGKVTIHDNFVKHGYGLYEIYDDGYGNDCITVKEDLYYIGKDDLGNRILY